jgi:hypothetical protein
MRTVVSCAPRQILQKTKLRGMSPRANCTVHANVTNEGLVSDTENIRGLNLEAVMCMTVQVTRLSLLRKLLVIGHNLLYRAWTERGLVYNVRVYTS